MRKKLIEKIVYVIQTILIVGFITGIIPALICGGIFKIFELGG